MPAPAFLQGLSSTAFSSAPPNTNIKQFPGNTTPGGLQILVLDTNPNTDVISSITDTEGNSAHWVIGPKIVTNAAQAIHTAYCLNCIGGTKNTITVNISGASQINSNMCIGEYSNVGALRSQDNSAAAGNSTAPLSGAISVIIGDLLIGWLGGAAGATSVTAGLTNKRNTVTSGADTGNTTYGAFEDQLAASTTANQRAGWTFGSSSVWSAGIFAFAPAAAGGGSKSWLTVAAANALRGLRH
jgi:hypothetical protein